MPTYDYHCDACGHEFEEFQSITAKPLKKCPKCGKQKLRRLIGGGAAILFRGSGFYQTDYRSSAYQKAAAAEKNNGSSSSGANGKSGGNGKAGSSETKSQTSSE